MKNTVLRSWERRAPEVHIANCEKFLRLRGKKR